MNIRKWGYAVLKQDKDIQILKQLYYGNHLSDQELERAYEVVKMVSDELQDRLKMKVIE